MYQKENQNYVWQINVCTKKKINVLKRNRKSGNDDSVPLHMRMAAAGKATMRHHGNNVILARGRQKYGGRPKLKRKR